MTCRVLEKGSDEYKRLETVAKVLEIFSKNKRRYWVGDCYLDYGSGWMWTTILRNSDSGTDVQVLSPREWEAIMAIDTLADMSKIIEDIRNGEYFND